jgi:hypothetical protein
VRWEGGAFAAEMLGAGDFGGEGGCGFELSWSMDRQVKVSLRRQMLEVCVSYCLQELTTDGALRGVGAVSVIRIQTCSY